MEDNNNGTPEILPDETETGTGADDVSDPGEAAAEVIDYTKLLQEIRAEAELTNSYLQEIRKESRSANEQLQEIRSDVRIILTFVILTFCWSCMRAWRKNILNMGV